jgi:hypothetical protein
VRDTIQTYAPLWQGRLLLACRKCQKKLKGDDDLRPLAKLKRTVKRYNKKYPNPPLNVINVPCMDLCPKDGVTICDPTQNPLRLSILRSEEDIERFYDAL